MIYHKETGNWILILQRGTGAIVGGFLSISGLITHQEERPMTRYLPVAAIAILMSMGSVLAAEDGQNPPSGADPSTGAKEQSSAPAGSEAEEDMSSESTEGASGDTSGGAKEQSSSPPGSSAADKSKPNPTTGSGN